MYPTTRKKRLKAEACDALFRADKDNKKHGWFKPNTTLLKRGSC
jgi:hypothetical protein